MMVSISEEMSINETLETIAKRMVDKNLGELAEDEDLTRFIL